MSLQFSVKWWDKFKVDRIAYYVYRDFPQLVNPPKPQPVSPVGSTHSSLSIEGKSKYELKELARQLMLQAFQMDDDEDSDADPSLRHLPVSCPLVNQALLQICVGQIIKTVKILMISDLTKATSCLSKSKSIQKNQSKAFACFYSHYSLASECES
ncbi:hypothetical protein L3X38_043744 [Prunus dulcis]|uniref:Uncharacterized protein n=1 Tax=Prunus dulcis TaxID=3755 RepID=A0AAD4UXM9_PRUDU|nr:hypothetical protein L3X38_043744 [Prunus dulcis]